MDNFVLMNTINFLLLRFRTPTDRQNRERLGRVRRLMQWLFRFVSAFSLHNPVRSGFNFNVAFFLSQYSHTFNVLSVTQTDKSQSLDFLFREEKLAEAKVTNYFSQFADTTKRLPFPR
jgi:hypothetical protein